MGSTTAPATATDVEDAYLAYFGRPADPIGMNYWLGKSVSDMQAGFAGSQEYANLYGGMDNTQVVTQVYKNVLGRSPDAGGLAYWVNQLNIKAATVGTIAENIFNNAEGIDISTIQNRFVFAIHFTESLDTPDQIRGYSGTASADAARIAVSHIDNTASSLTTAESNMTLDIQAVDQGISPDTLEAENAAAANAATAAVTAANNLSLYGSINGVTQTSATQAFTLAAGANTVAMVGGSAAVVDTFTYDVGTTSLTVNISGTATGAHTFAGVGNPGGLTSMTLNDSSAGAVTVDAVTANALATLTANNTGTATLTLSNLNDSATSLTVNLQGTGVVTETSLSGLSVASLTVNDTSSVNQALVSFADNSLTSASFANTGTGTLTVNTLTANNLHTVSMTGSAEESVAITNNSSSMTITDSNTYATNSITLAVYGGSGSRSAYDTIVLNAAAAAQDTGGLNVTGFYGNFTGDVLNVSLAHALGGSLVNSSNGTVGVGQSSEYNVSSGFTTPGVNVNFVQILGTSYSTDALALSAIAIGGASVVTFAANISLNNSVLVGYMNGGNEHIIEITQGATGATLATNSPIHDVVTLTGITGINFTNLSFVA